MKIFNKPKMLFGAKAAFLLFVLATNVVSARTEKAPQKGKLSKTVQPSKAEAEKKPANHIENVWLDIARKIKQIPDDPFDHSAKQNKIKDLLAGYDDFEILIPTSSYQEKNDPKKIYPLSYSDGKISFYLLNTVYTSNLLLATGYVVYRSDSINGRRADNGRYCTSYDEISGYSLSYSWDKINKISATIVGSNKKVTFEKGSIKIESNLDVDDARRLSGDLVFYATLKNVRFADEAGNSSRFSMDSDGNCTSGWNRYIDGDLKSFYIKKKSSGEKIFEVIVNQ